VILGFIGMLFCNINFNVRNKKELFEYHGFIKLIFTPNAAIIVEANRSKRLMELLNRNYVCFDGQIPYLAARIFCKDFNKNNFEKLSGSDIIYDFCQFAEENGLSIFFLGGKPENNRLAVKNIKKNYELMINGFSPWYEDYPFSSEFNKKCLDEITVFNPDILFVGFGTPKENYWVEDNFNKLRLLNLKYVICCGGTFEFVSNKIKRAPKFIQKIGLEGVWRFFQEPNKMRYKRLVESLLFVKYIW
jgi:N-acetylglucosaminyldiphosphoundecaprenol N-acetyl-beta-D-mannosaminyltransferase